MENIFAKSATKKSNPNLLLDGATKKEDKMDNEKRELEKDRLGIVNHCLNKLVIKLRSLSQKRKKLLTIRKKIKLRVENGSNYQKTKINNKFLMRISSLFFRLEERNECLLMRINELEREKFD